MKSTTDLVNVWIRKAESDLAIVELCLSSARSLDTGAIGE